MIIKKIYHPYWKWEDYLNGMYKIPKLSEFDNLLNFAIEFTSNHIEYGTVMGLVVENWKYCVEENLTNVSMNRRAWLGHAGVNYKFKIPKIVTKSAWKYLTEEQRILANMQADKWINYYFNKKNVVNNQLTLSL